MARSILGYRVLATGLLTGAAVVTVGAVPAFSAVLMAPADLPRPVNLAQQTASRPTLRLGSVGESVSELQSMLSLMGYYSGAIDGFYREQTQTAVVNFQADANIVNDGIVGPTTWQKLFPPPDGLPVATLPVEPETEANPPAEEVAASEEPDPVALPVLRQGMSGPAVTRLQTRLQALGFYEGPIDGSFGPQTEIAVQGVQARNQLEADGIVGPATWSVLLR
ncbi:MAG: peptidoglycan-binding protein [Cyanobacteria bacterium J06635_1]